MTTVGGYEIEGPLGEGGMGVVYRARDVTLDRPVAVKVIRPEGLTPEALQRFGAVSVMIEVSLFRFK